MNRSQAIELLVVVVIVLIYCWGTYQRNLVWKTGASLWTDVLKKSHAKARPHCNLGRSYLRNRAYALAIPQLKEALRLRPNFMEAHYNLGIAYQGIGLYDKAIAEYENILHKRQHAGVSNDNITFSKPYFAKFGRMLFSQGVDREGYQGI